jgi:hypothetical protein
MKKFLTSSIFISGILFFASCKKENSVLNPQAGEELATQKVKPPTTPIRVKTDFSSFGTRTFTYNADFNSTGNTGISPKVYTYPDATHIIETSSNGPERHFTLNKKGLIETITTPHLTEYWTFNSKKQLTEIFTVGSTGDIAKLIYVYNGDGNLDTLSEVTNGKLAWYETFTYYPDQPNVMDNDVFGEGFFGVSSNNLMKTSEWHTGSSVSLRNQSYVYDPFGRVIKVSATVNGSAQPDHIFTYY